MWRIKDDTNNKYPKFFIFNNKYNNNKIRVLNFGNKDHTWSLPKKTKTKTISRNRPQNLKMTIYIVHTCAPLKTKQKEILPEIDKNIKFVHNCYNKKRV